MAEQKKFQVEYNSKPNVSKVDAGACLRREYYAKNNAWQSPKNSSINELQIRECDPYGCQFWMFKKC